MTATFIYAVSGPLLLGLFGIGIGLWTLSKIRRGHRSQLAAERLRGSAGSDAAG
jgi:hypothetical protein